MNTIPIDPATLRAQHRIRIEKARLAANAALVSALTPGRRTDCLIVALRSLDGALRCVRFEDAEVET